MSQDDINDAEIPTKFVEKPSPHLKCPICGGFYRDPVINIKCGHTFCRACVFSTTKCPVDDSHCDTSQVVVNRLVVGQIEDILIYCRHGLIKGKNGIWDLATDSCQQIVSIGKRNEHEDTCLFALVRCPFSDKCAQMRKKDLEQHKKFCNQVGCKFAEKGCKYRGTHKKVEEHLKVCVHNQAFGDSRLAVKVAEQETALRALQEENFELGERVRELEESKTQMKTQMDRQGSMIQDLQNKLESLLSKLDQTHNAPTVIKRPFSTSQISLADSVISNSRGSSITPLRSTSPGRNYEKWEMPFQFKCIGTLRGHKDVVWAMTTRKGHLFSAGADGIIKIWSLEQLAKGCVGNIPAHKGVIHCLATWGNNLVSAGADKCVHIWDLETYQRKSTIADAHEQIICSMAVCESLLFTSSFATVKVWDLKTMQSKASLQSENHWVRALALSKGKDKLYSGSHNAINIWDTKESFEKLATIHHECGSVYSLAVSKTYIIAGNSGNYEQNIQVFNIETHEFVMNFCGHIGTVTTLVISPSGQFLFSASHDSTIQMWGLEKMLPIQNLSRHQGSVNTLTLHGDFLLSGSEDHEVKVFRYFRMQ